jgi:hypothetical protein
MKKAIALFLTLSFLLIALTLINSLLLKYQKATQQNYLFISQNSLFIKDSIKILNSMEFNSTKDLTQTFPIFTPSFIINVNIRPINSININDLNISLKLLKILSQKYELKDFEYLKDLILDLKDKDDIQRAPFSEINAKEGYIYPINFKKIIDAYYKYTKDENIFKVPFFKYFNFKKTQISSFFEFANELNLTIISLKNRHFFVDVNINYKDNNISILYDIKTKKAQIEASPIY